MTTLHILRSQPDDEVRELIEALMPGSVTTVAQSDGPIDFDQLVAAIFHHDRVIFWW